MISLGLAPAQHPAGRLPPQLSNQGIYSLHLCMACGLHTGTSAVRHLAAFIAGQGPPGAVLLSTLNPRFHLTFLFMLVLLLPLATIWPSTTITHLQNRRAVIPVDAQIGCAHVTSNNPPDRDLQLCKSLMSLHTGETLRMTLHWSASGLHF